MMINVAGRKPSYLRPPLSRRQNRTPFRTKLLGYSFPFLPEADLDKCLACSTEQESHKKWGKMSERSATFSGLCHYDRLCGVLQHLKVDLHDSSTTFYGPTLLRNRAQSRYNPARFLLSNDTWGFVPCRRECNN